MKEKEISQKLHRNTLFEAMDKIVDERKDNFEKLKRSIVAMNQRAMPKCWYGISCYRRFCKFDHSNIFRKDNSIQVPTLPAVQDLLCDKCGLNFLNLETFYQHVETNHIRIKCSKWGKYFGTAQELEQHTEQQEHQESFGNNDEETQRLAELLENLVHDEKLNSEDKSVGKVPRIFQCGHCELILKSKTGLKKHKKRIHKSYIEKVVSVPEMNKSDEKQSNQVNSRKFECGMCVLDFASGMKMNQHMDGNHGGRWKFDDPDVVLLGDDYQESSDDYSSTEEFSDSENSETQSGEE